MDRPIQLQVWDAVIKREIKAQEKALCPSAPVSGNEPACENPPQKGTVVHNNSSGDERAR